MVHLRQKKVILIYSFVTMRIAVTIEKGRNSWMDLSCIYFEKGIEGEGKTVLCMQQEIEERLILLYSLYYICVNWQYYIQKRHRCRVNYINRSGITVLLKLN